jgi:hypothetical protein
MLTKELIEFVQSGLSTIVGTAGSDGRPQCMRGVGLISLDEGRKARLFLPCVGAGPTLQNLTTTRRIAVSLAQLGTHRAVQLKGTLFELALASETERTEMDRLFTGILDRLAYVGFPRAIINNVSRWPSWRVDFDITDVFVQTPGPHAGQRLGGEVAWI